MNEEGEKKSQGNFNIPPPNLLAMPPRAEAAPIRLILPEMRPITFCVAF